MRRILKNIETRGWIMSSWAPCRSVRSVRWQEKMRNTRRRMKMMDDNLVAPTSRITKSAMATYLVKVQNGGLRHGVMKMEIAEVVGLPC